MLKRLGAKVIVTQEPNSYEPDMSTEIGQIALILALLVAVVQAILPMIGAQRHNVRLMAVADRAASLQFILITLSFAALTYAFVTSDFSVRLVALNSHTDKPLLYKFTGVWANHEGSMMLWVLILSIYGALIAHFGKALPSGLKARALAIQGLIGVGFLAFILFTSNPFLRLDPAPLNGQGMNPLLQDPGLAFHPPFLYLGYVGFSVPFSFALAALIEGRIDAVWARWLRPWVLTAWSFLTIGIVMGSVWSYYELGWGGWWVWDPVENVSFMPWLIGTALLHSIMVLGKRHAMAHWTILLAITAFSLSLIGTFVVRSGVLTSVHSFAVDPKRGIFILALLVVATGGGLVLYSLRAGSLTSGPDFAPVSKEGSLLLNNLLLATATFTVFLGTFYPLLIEAFTNGKISVGAPFFDRTFAPVMIVLIGFMGIGPLLKWRKDSWQTAQGFLLKSVPVLLLIAALVWWRGKSVLGGLSLGVAAWLALSTLVAVAKRIGLGRPGVLQRMKAQPAAFWSFALAHLGLAIAMVGITGMSVWAVQEAKVVKIGESFNVGAYEFTLKDVKVGRRENFEELAAQVQVSRNDKAVAHLHTARRFYPVRGMMTSEAGIQVRPLRNLYAGISDGDADKGWVIRAYVHPLVNWIWLGGLLMALAGFVSIFSTARSRNEKNGGAV